MAVNATPTGLSGRLNSPRVQRWLPWLAGLVLLTGLIAFLISHYGTNTAKPIPGANQPAGTQKLAPTPPTVALAPATRIAAARFIKYAVTRKDATIAYQLSGPDIRGGETLAQWKRDWNGSVGVPIVPYTKPISKVAIIHMNHSWPTEAEFEVAILPKQGFATTFLMDVNKYGSGRNAHWRVNYWSSNSKAAIPAPG